MMRGATRGRGAHDTGAGHPDNQAVFVAANIKHDAPIAHDVGTAERLFDCPLL
jgi:hypothetical protein